MALSPITRRRLYNFRANRRGYVSFWIFLALLLVTLCAELICQRQAHRHALRRRPLRPDPLRVRGDRVRRRLRDRGGLSRPLRRRADRGEGVDGLAAGPLQLPDHQLRPAGAGAGAAIGRQLARHRRPGPRRAGARDLRLPPLGAVRPGAHRCRLGHRHRRGRGAGLLRRLDRTSPSSASSRSGRGCRSSSS